MSYHGIIFDLDGTLVDTEPIHRDAWFSVLAAYDLHFGNDWFEQWIGQSDRVLAEAVEKFYKVPVKAGDLQVQKRTIYHQMAAEKARMFPGVEEQLLLLKDKYRMGIATNSSDQDASAVFTSTKLDQHFQTVVTADMVDRLKPAPDLYLLASKRIGLFTDACIVVEDSPAGVKGAKAAGMFVLAVTNSHPEKSLQAADRIFPNTQEAMQFIVGMG
ncbi:MAG: HAD family phosphatase [Saprospiraceae bacterium]|nr:HAD family phosphatase [Lewinella sp.]